MPYHIKKASLVSHWNVGVDMYYSGDNHWTDDYAKRKVYASKALAEQDQSYTYTKNGNTIQPNFWKSSTIITEL
tara:strand:- start:427 stop:648 length:222 start_codon:yes stop_codon:yes gene_type:complete